MLGNCESPFKTESNVVYLKPDRFILRLLSKVSLILISVSKLSLLLIAFSNLGLVNS